uniref:Adenine phosphoribosyltransferase n=1 Tax=Syphacia muris TaxID=451379 RepID=A0A0N5AX89_9BILA
MANGAELEFSKKSKRDLQHIREEVSAHLRYFPDFPKKGIVFVDIMKLMRNSALLDELCKAVAEHVRAEIPVFVDAVGALESRGFLFGPQIAIALNVPFIPIRKKGKLPGKTLQAVYQKEYGEDVIEIQADAVQPQSKVLLVDDLLATGGTLGAAIKLIEKAGGEVVEAFVLVQLSYLNPLEHIPKHTPVYSLIKIDE